MPTKIVAPPKRKGGRPADLRELPGFIAIFKDMAPDDESWVQADHAGSVDKRNATTTKRQQYADALEKEFGYKFQSRGYTDPETPTVFRFALAFDRDPETKALLLPDGTVDATANDGVPQSVEVPA